MCSARSSPRQRLIDTAW